MNKLMSMAMAAVLLPTVSFADAPANTYVVPAGGSTPTDPYETWVTAANEIRTAADAVATHGLVTIVSGDYSGEAKPLTPKQAVEMKIVDAVDSTAPGTATICSPLFGFNVANTDPNCHALTVSKGTMKLSSGASNLFSDGTADGGSAYSGAKSNFRMHFTGSETHLDLSGKTFYCGYNSSGSQFRLSDNAKLTMATLLLGMTSTGGYDTKFIVDSGASVTCSSGTQIGDQTTGCTLTISNATYSTPSLTVGATDLKARSHRVIVCGSADATLKGSGTLTLRNDSTLEMNVAETPLAGYSSSKGLVYFGNVSCNSNATLQVTGLETLAQRLEEADQKTFSTYVLFKYGGTGEPLVLGDGTLARLKESVAAVPGFSVSVKTHVQLNWSRPPKPHTFVVPEGTEGNVPTEQYLTWATASTNILLAVQQTAANGLVTITNGTYSADKQLVDSRAVNLEVVDYESPTGAGEATIGFTFFGNAVANPTDDPNVNSVTLSKGTFKCAGSKDGVFVDYLRSGSYGAMMNARFVVTGEDTVLDTLTTPLYIGFLMKGIRATVTDRAQMKTGQIYIGLSGNSGSSGLTVSNGGSVSNINGVLVGNESTGCYLTVSNGTLASSTISLDKAGMTHGIVATIAGSNSVVTCSSSFTATGDSKLRFNVADAPLAGYATVPLSAKNLNFNEDSALEIVGADALLARMAEADVGYVKLVLATASGTLSISDEKLTAARATLPERVRLSAEGGKLVLRLGERGMTLIVR